VGAEFDLSDGDGADAAYTVMGWAMLAIERSQRGETVVLRPRGHSKTGRINDGDRVTDEPFGTREPAVGDSVLVRCRGHEYLHLIKARRGDQFLIGNNRGGINGWVTRHHVFGLATQIATS